MCLPLAVALPLAAAGMSAAGQIMGGMQANNQAKYEAGVARQNAALERDAAEQSIEQGKSERLQFWRKVGSVKGQQIASMAANGIDVGYGTAARVQDDTQQLANEDASNLYKNISNRTSGFIIDAANYKMEAKAKKAAGKAALIGSIFGAGSSLLGGFTQTKGASAKLGTSSAYGGGG